MEEAARLSELVRLLSSTELEASKAGKTLLPAAVCSSRQPLTACDSRMSEQSETRLTDVRTDGGVGWGGGGAGAGVVPVGVSADLEALLPETMRRCVDAESAASSPPLL